MYLLKYMYQINKQTNTYVNVYTYLHIQIPRDERGRAIPSPVLVCIPIGCRCISRLADIHAYVYVYIYMYICVYLGVYMSYICTCKREIERVLGRERERDREPFVPIPSCRSFCSGGFGKKSMKQNEENCICTRELASGSGGQRENQPEGAVLQHGERGQVGWGGKAI